jgi:hypothetical protein
VRADWKKFLHKSDYNHYQQLRIVSVRKLIVRINKSMKPLISIIVWPTRRPLTVVASQVLVKTAAESSTRSFSDIIWFYESLVVFKATILLEKRLGFRSVARIGTCSGHRCIVRINRCYRLGQIF